MLIQTRVNIVRIGLVYLRPRQVGFVRAVGPYSASSAKAWDEMFAWMTRNNLDGRIDRGYGLAVDDPQTVAAAQCRYEACIELPDSFVSRRNDSLALQTLPGGAFARVRHVGPYHNVRTSIAKVCDDWLVNQPCLRADRRRPLLTIFLDDPKRQLAEKLRCDVCVPVRTLHEDVFQRTKFTSDDPAAHSRLQS